MVEGFRNRDFRVMYIVGSRLDWGGSGIRWRSGVRWASGGGSYLSNVLPVVTDHSLFYLEG